MEKQPAFYREMARNVEIKEELRRHDTVQTPAPVGLHAEMQANEKRLERLFDDDEDFAGPTSYSDVVAATPQHARNVRTKYFISSAHPDLAQDSTSTNKLYTALLLPTALLDI